MSEEAVKVTTEEATKAAPALMNEAADAIVIEATKDWAKLPMFTFQKRALLADTQLRQLLSQQIEDHADMLVVQDTKSKLCNLIDSAFDEKGRRLGKEDLYSYVKTMEATGEGMRDRLKKDVLSENMSSLSMPFFYLGRLERSLKEAKEALAAWDAEKAARGGVV